MSSSNPKKFDITRELPDELLCYILSFVTSIPEKLGLAVVSSKFKRCVFTQLQQPTTLEINFNDGLLNGHIPSHKWCAAIKAYSQIALTVISPHMLKICIKHQRYWTIKFNEQRKTLDQVLVAIDSDCLEQQVKCFELELPCDQSDVLETVLSKCHKLSVARLRFVLSPTQLNLSAVLKNKPLTELELQLNQYSQEQLVHLFRSLRPNSLHKVQLGFIRMPRLDLALLVKKSAETWGALQEFRIYFRHTPFVMDPRIIARLPSLKHFCIAGESFDWAKLTAWLSAVFQNSGRSQPLTVQFEGTTIYEDKYHGISSCKILSTLAQIRKTHKSLQVHIGDFVFGDYDYPISYNLTFVLGNVSFMTADVDHIRCNRHRDCRDFYPNFLTALQYKIEAQRSGHLEGRLLTRCKIECVLGHLTDLFQSDFGLGSHLLKVRYADLDKSQDLVVITVESRRFSETMQYYVTVSIGPCLNHCCLKCLDI